MICDIFQLMERLIRTRYQSLTQLLELSSAVNIISKDSKKLIVKLEEAIKSITKLQDDFSMVLISSPSLISGQNGSRTEAKMIQEDYNNKIDKLSQELERIAIKETAINSTQGSQISLLSMDVSTLMNQRAIPENVNRNSNITPDNCMRDNMFASQSISTEWSFIN